MRVIVVGAGIIGTALALQLVRQGAEVLILERGPGPANGATAASFGWINAGFHHDAAHYRLRAEGISAWHRLAQSIDLAGALHWCGALNWELSGAALSAWREDLDALGYASTLIDAERIATLEPALAAPPDAALHFAQEAAADPTALCATLLAAAQVTGARAIFGIDVTAATAQQVSTSLGCFEADAVALCAGNGASDLMAGGRAALPMRTRPALILRSPPLPRLVHHILVTPDGEIRQDAEGRLIMPTSVSHQGDASDRIVERPDQVADAAAARLRRLFGENADVRWSDVSHARRPVPGDGLPVVGPVGDSGPYLAVMHSGITLAAIIAELAAAELLDTGSNQTGMLAPYRPDRFSQTGRPAQ